MSDIRANLQWYFTINRQNNGLAAEEQQHRGPPTIMCMKWWPGTPSALQLHQLLQSSHPQVRMILLSFVNQILLVRWGLVYFFSLLLDQILKWFKKRTWDKIKSQTHCWETVTQIKVSSLLFVLIVMFELCFSVFMTVFDCFIEIDVWIKFFMLSYCHIDDALFAHYIHPNITTTLRENTALQILLFALAIDFLKEKALFPLNWFKWGMNNSTGSEVTLSESKQTNKQTNKHA